MGLVSSSSSFLYFFFFLHILVKTTKNWHQDIEEELAFQGDSKTRLYNTIQNVDNAPLTLHRQYQIDAMDVELVVDNSAISVKEIIQEIVSSFLNKVYFDFSIQQNKDWTRLPKT